MERLTTRYYLTTAIAYANNRPGLHTLFDVFGADVMARWHRMKGDDTFFLTGTDEYSVNIALTAQAQGRDPKAFVDEMVELYRARGGRPRHRPRSLHPHDRSRPPAGGPRDDPPGPRRR